VLKVGVAAISPTAASIITGTLCILDYGHRPHRGMDGETARNVAGGIRPTLVGDFEFLSVPARIYLYFS
jgi:hypothetical protein